MWIDLKAFLKSREAGQLDLSSQLLKNALREQTKTESKVISDPVQRDISSANQASVQQRQMER